MKVGIVGVGVVGGEACTSPPNIPLMFSIMPPGPGVGIGVVGGEACTSPPNTPLIPSIMPPGVWGLGETSIVFWGGIRGGLGIGAGIEGASPSAPAIPGCPIGPCGPVGPTAP